MHEDSRKLKLIAAIVALEDEAVLEALERVIERRQQPATVLQTGNAATSSWSADDVDEMNRIIEEGFQ